MLRYYLETDLDTNEPIKLLRAVDGRITAWNGERWVKAPGYLQPEMDGLGGYAPFDLIAESQVHDWKLRIMGEPVPPRRPADPAIGGSSSEVRPKRWNFEPYPISGSFAEDRALAARLAEERLAEEE